MINFNIGIIIQMTLEQKNTLLNKIEQILTYRHQK